MLQHATVVYKANAILCWLGRNVLNKIIFLTNQKFILTVKQNYFERSSIFECIVYLTAGWNVCPLRAPDRQMLSKVYCLFRIMLFSKLILFLGRYRPFPLSQGRTTQVTRHILSEIIKYLWVTLLALLCLCHCRYFIGCPGRTLIGPSFSIHFTRLISLGVILSNPDRPSWLVGSVHDTTFLACVFTLLLSDHAAMSTVGR